MTSRILIYNSYYYCGGTLVLSELCSALRELGYDAKLFFVDRIAQNANECENQQNTYVRTGLILSFMIAIWKIFPFKWIEERYHLKSRFPLQTKGRVIKWFPLFSRKHTIVIYPETVYGNPFKARNVVRWLLYNYKFATEESAFSKSDLFIGYREVFNDRAFTPDIENIQINSFNKDLYKRYNFGKRQGKCYIIGKGRDREDLLDCYDGPVVDDLSEEEKVKIFNQCEYCYSYDTQTFYSSIAAICGCKSIIVPERGKREEDYRISGECTYGVAWSDNQKDIDEAIDSVKLLERKISKIKERNHKEAEHLVKILEDRFKTRIKRVSKRINN